MVSEHAWLDYYKNMMRDHAAESSFNNSETLREFARIEMERDELRKQAELERSLDAENAALSEVVLLNKKIAANPALFAHLKRAKEFLENNPAYIAQVDPNFVRALDLIDFSVGDE